MNILTINGQEAVRTKTHLLYPNLHLYWIIGFYVPTLVHCYKGKDFGIFMEKDTFYWIDLFRY